MGHFPHRNQRYESLAMAFLLFVIRLREVLPNLFWSRAFGKHLQLYRPLLRMVHYQCHSHLDSKTSYLHHLFRCRPTVSPHWDFLIGPICLGSLVFTHMNNLFTITCFSQSSHLQQIKPAFFVWEASGVSAGDFIYDGFAYQPGLYSGAQAAG